MDCFGRYEIIGELGRGAMGAVYKARDPLMDRDVAIKTILAHAAGGDEAAEFRERFFREARAAGRLAHPGIVTVFDVSEHENTPFLVMEYVAGQTLQSMLQSGARLNLGDVRELAIQLAVALQYAHQNGVVHRDIKPANILVTADRRTKIADFGVAKLVEAHATSTGQMLGTPAFMAPEQFAGLPVDGRADLFALGVVIYWMATGDKPFTGDTILAVQYKVVHTDPVPPRKLNPAIPSALEAIILKCVEKDPAMRYQSGEEVARDLRLWRTDRAAEGTEPGTFRMEATFGPTLNLASRSQRPRRNARRAVGISVLIALLGLITFGLMRPRSQSPAPPDTSVATAAPAIVPPQRESTELQPAGQAASTPSAAPVTEVKKTLDGPRVMRPLAPRGTGDSRASAAPVAVAPNNADDETKPPSVAPPPQVEAPAPPEDELPPDNRNAIGSPVRQKELAESYNSARLLITSPAVPEILTIIVSVDNELLFRHDAATAPVFAVENGQRRLLARGVHAAPLTEELALPPGKHKLRVHVLLAARRVGRAQEVSDRFYSTQRRTLDIQFSPAGPRERGEDGDANRFSVSLR